MKQLKKSAKGKRPEDLDPDAVDIDSPAYASVDWNTLPREKIELDPKLIEHIRKNYRLTQITLRIGEEQIAEAKRVAKRTGDKYQVVLRRWLAQGASLSRLKQGTSQSAGKK